MKSELVKKAQEFATRAHEGQFRKKTNEPYIVHPERVAKIMKKQGFSVEVIAAAWLHDVVEDCEISLLEIKKEFGKDVAFLVDGMTKVSGFGNTLRKLEKFIKKDKRIFWLKMADMENNIDESQEDMDDVKLKMKFFARLFLFEKLAKGKREKDAVKRLRKKGFRKFLNFSI